MLVKAGVVFEKRAKFNTFKPISGKGEAMQKQWMKDAYHLLINLTCMLSSTAIMTENIQSHCACLPFNIDKYGK
tara:strand:- start:288 stop:509 length:222 start_codon:yes stop_codon:yes gene_type:complete